MTVASAEVAVTNALSYTRCVKGKCLAYTRTWLGIGSLYPSASSAWNHAAHRHPGDKAPPRGAPVLWTGGSRGFGHIALSLGGGLIRSTDVEQAGHVSTVPIGWFAGHWPDLAFAGWTEDLNDEWIPWLRPAPPPPPPVRSDGDSMLITHKTSTGSSFWLVSGGKMVSVNATDQASWTGPEITITGPASWDAIVAAYG